MPYNEELRIAVIEEYMPLFRQYTFKFACGYKLHVAREKGVQYISDSIAWTTSADTITQRRVQAADAAFLMFDQKLSHCMGKGIDVPTDGAQRIMANPDIGVEDIEKQLSQGGGKYPKRTRKKTERFVDRPPEENRKKRRREMPSSSVNEPNGEDGSVEDLTQDSLTSSTETVG